MDNFQGHLLPQHPEPVYRNEGSSQVKTAVIFLITSTVVLFILISSLIILLTEKEQTSPSSVSIATLMTSHATMMTTTTTTSIFVPTSQSTTSSPDNGTKPTTSPSPRIPRYNSNKTIVAGNGSTFHELNKPIAIVVDSEHNFYVLDSGNSRVLKYFSNSKTEQIIIGHGVDRYPRVSNLLGLVIDKNDLLYTYHEDSTRHGYIVMWPSSLENGTEIIKVPGRLSGFAIDQHLDIYIVSAINLAIWLAPTYRSSIFKRVFGQSDASGQLPVGTSNIYVDFNMDFFAIDIQNYRVQRMPKDDEYSDTIISTKPTPVAIVGDYYRNLYTIDSQSSLIIYNSDGQMISAMNNTLDNPRDSDYWIHSYTGPNNQNYIPDYFGTIALDAKNGDLYVIMFSYNRVIKFTLI